MNKVTLSNEYQVVIPKEVREKIGLKAGVSLEIITYSNRIELIPIKPIKNLKGMLKGIDANIMRDEDRIWSFSQNSVGFGKSFRKSGLKPAFSYKFRVAFPKTEVLGKPRY
jgi:AbrB family looped-hinge helix DNA binding protein